MKKTLGGERLGSGNRMKVELKNYERSTHDLGYIWRSTMSAGTLVPFLKLLALPGDTLDINLNADIKTHPTIGPLFGSYKVQLDVFEAPIRLYQGQLHNNKLGIGMNMSQVLLPQITLTAFRPSDDLAVDIDNSQINPSSILAYLGIRGIGTINAVYSEDHADRTFNAVPLLAYWDIYKNYYSNKQEEIGAVIHSNTVALVDTITTASIEQAGGGESPYAEYGALSPETHIVEGTTTFNFHYVGARPIPSQVIIRFNNAGGMQLVPANELLNIRYTNIMGTLTMSGDWNTAKYGFGNTQVWNMISSDQIETAPIEIKTFALSNIDTMREAILAASTDPSAFNVNEQDYEPYNLLLTPEGSRNPFLSSQEGLGLKTYQSDLFNNWLQTEWIDGPNGITEITSIDTTGGSISIDQINLAKKVYDMLNRIAVSGGTYDDWLDVTYTHDRITRAESPIYHGGLIKELVFQEVVSNSGSNSNEGGDQPLGTLAGKGVLSHKHKGGKMTIRVNEPSYVIGIISLTPRIDYSQGNEWDTHLETMDDFHKPALDEIGFQELITEQMAWWDTKINTGVWTTKSAGKQPAWINYMTAVNKVLGNFAIPNNEMFMTLNRRYEPDYSLVNVLNGIKDVTTYIDPVKFNHIFAQTSIDSQNFWSQISVDITARRKMSAKIMPNL